MRAGPRASLTGDFTFDATSGNANDINTVWGFDNRNPPGEAGDNIGPPRDWVSFGGGSKGGGEGMHRGSFGTVCMHPCHHVLAGGTHMISHVVAPLTPSGQLASRRESALCVMFEGLCTLQQPPPPENKFLLLAPLFFFFTHARLPCSCNH